MTNCSRSRTGINSNTDARDADDEALKRSGSDFRPCNSQQSFAVMFMLHLAKRTISGRTGCLRVPPEQAIEVLGNASTDRASPRMLPGCVRNNAATSMTEAPVKARTRFIVGLSEVTTACTMKRPPAGTVPIETARYRGATLLTQLRA
jgi:hypothetical protein